MIETQPVRSLCHRYSLLLTASDNLRPANYTLWRFKEYRDKPPSVSDQLPVFLDSDWHFKWNNHRRSRKEAIFVCAETSVPAECVTTKSHRGPSWVSMEVSVVWVSRTLCSEMSRLWLSVVVYAQSVYILECHQLIRSFQFHVSNAISSEWQRGSEELSVFGTAMFYGLLLNKFIKDTLRCKHPTPYNYSMT